MKKLKRQYFSDLIVTIAGQPKQYPIANAFAREQTITFIPDRYVLFSNKRASDSIHLTRRPTAIMQNTGIDISFIPCTHKTVIKDPYALVITPEQARCMNLHQAGTFLIRYWQREPAEKMNSMDIRPGGRIPDDIFINLRNKLRSFILSQGN